MDEYVDVTVTYCDGTFEGSQTERTDDLDMLGVCVGSALCHTPRPLLALAEAVSFLAECEHDPDLATQSFAVAAEAVIDSYRKMDREYGVGRVMEDEKC